MPSARAVRAENILMVGPWESGKAASSPGEDYGPPPRPDSAIFDGCTQAFLVAWPGFGLDYPEWAQRLHAERIPFSLVLPVPRSATGGPLALAAYFPLEDVSPCWRCLELRLLGWSEDPERDGAFLEALRCGGEAPAPPPDEEEAVLLRWLAMDVTGSDPGVALVAAPDGGFTVHAFAPHPLCAICSPWAGASAAPRQEPPERLVDPRLGLLRWVGARLEVAETSPTFGDSLRAPKLTLPPFGPVLDEPAEEAATLDGLASYAFRLRAGRPMWRGTRHGIPVSAVHPGPFLSVEGADLGRYDEARELDWQRGHKLSWGEDVGIPADLIFGGPPWDRLAHPNPAGLAAHRNIEVAVRVALTRVAAADGLMAWWYMRLAPPRVPADQLPENLREELDAAADAGWETAVVQVTTDLAVPALAILARSRRGGFTWGCGADLDPAVALGRARAAWRRAPLGNGSAHPSSPHPQYAALDFLFEGEERRLGPAHPDAHVHPLDTWRVYLHAAGMQAWWVDLTPPDVAPAGLVVVKALISNALPLVWRGRPCTRRLLDLPRRFGRRDRPLDPLDLNPDPHPFHTSEISLESGNLLDGWNAMQAGNPA